MSKDALFEQLRDAWSNAEVEDRLRRTIHRARSELGQDALLGRMGLDSLLLYGINLSPNDDVHRETYIGELIAIDTGVVLFSPSDGLQPLVGILIKNSGSNPLYPLFSLKAFIKETCADLCIRTNAEIQEVKFSSVCPVYIYWQLGAGQLEGYERLGICTSRWLEMEVWFNKWLPEK